MGRSRSERIGQSGGHPPSPNAPMVILFLQKGNFKKAPSINLATGENGDDPQRVANSTRMLLRDHKLVTKMSQKVELLTGLTTSVTKHWLVGLPTYITVEHFSQ